MGPGIPENYKHPNFIPDTMCVGQISALPVEGLFKWNQTPNLSNSYVILDQCQEGEVYLSFRLI